MLLLLYTFRNGITYTWPRWKFDKYMVLIHHCVQNETFLTCKHNDSKIQRFSCLNFVDEIELQRRAINERARV